MKSNGKTVVIADDHETLIMYLSILLHRMGFEVIPAKNGEEVMQVLESVCPDAVITDRRMPVMDGLTTLKLIKNDPRFDHVPVIVMSAYFDQAVHDECIDAGAKGFLPKPIKINALNKLLQESVNYPNNVKRKNLRCDYGRRVLVTHNELGKDFFAVTLSEGGIYLRAQKPLPVGETVHIQLELHPGQSVEVSGTVIYQKSIANDVFKIDPGMAIRFEDLSAQNSDQLHAYIIEELAGDLKDEQEVTVIDDMQISADLRRNNYGELSSASKVKRLEKC